MAKKSVYVIANRRVGDIIIPRIGKGLILQQTKPLIIPGGKAVEVDGTEWELLKKNAGIQNYVDAGILVEVKKAGEVPIMMERTSNPIVPEHLLREEEVANPRQDQNGSLPLVKASVKRKNKSTAIIQ